MLPRAGQKELPTLSSHVASVAPPPPLAVPVATAARSAPAPPPMPVAAPVPVAAAPPPALGQPTGSTQGKGAITMSASDFPFMWYLQTIQRKVNEKWAPPERPSHTNAVVVFEIGRDGGVKNPAVERSSGDAQYDQAALRAIVEAHPFPPLPEEFRQPALKIHLGFNFSTDRG
jgi:TonB family protein